jgi:hypothetical protein
MRRNCRAVSLSATTATVGTLEIVTAFIDPPSTAVLPTRNRECSFLPVVALSEGSVQQSNMPVRRFTYPMQSSPGGDLYDAVADDPVVRGRQTPGSFQRGGKANLAPRGQARRRSERSAASTRTGLRVAKSSRSRCSGPHGAAEVGGGSRVLLGRAPREQRALAPCGALTRVAGLRRSRLATDGTCARERSSVPCRRSVGGCAWRGVENGARCGVLCWRLSPASSS